MNPIETIKLNVEGEICPYLLIRILKKIKDGFDFPKGTGGENKRSH